MPPRKNFVLPGEQIKPPGAPILNQRDRKRLIVLANFQGGPAVIFRNDPVRRVIRRNEFGPRIAVREVITRTDDTSPKKSEDGPYPAKIVGPGCIGQGLGRLVRSVELPLTPGRGRHSDQQQHHQRRAPCKPPVSAYTAINKNDCPHIGLRSRGARHPLSAILSSAPPRSAGLSGLPDRHMPPCWTSEEA